MTLAELFDLLKKHLVLVIALPVFCAAVMAAYSLFAMPVKYTSEVTVYALLNSSEDIVGSGEDGQIKYSDTNYAFQISQNVVNDISTLAKSGVVKKQVAEELGLKNLGPFEINVVSQERSRVIYVRVEGTDPDKVPLVANKLVEVLDKQARSVMDVQAVNIINSAESPALRSGPPRKRLTLTAAMVGLFAAIGIVVLRDMLDTTVRREDEITDLTGLPIIGRFPSV